MDSEKSETRQAAGFNGGHRVLVSSQRREATHTNTFPDVATNVKKALFSEPSQQTLTASMAALEKTLLDTLKSRFETGAPWRGPVGQKRAQLQQELEGRWSKYVEREMAKVDVAQASVDTPEEYERVANSCDGEIKKRLR